MKEDIEELFDNQSLNPDDVIPNENDMGTLITKEETLHALKTTKNGNLKFKFIDQTHNNTIVKLFNNISNLKLIRESC